MKFLLDTNFLMAIGQFKIDIFYELTVFGKPEFFTIDLVIKELHKLSLGSGRDSKAATLALDIIGRKSIEVLNTGGKEADAEIERLAAEGGYTVCTTDKELTEKLKKEEVLVIGIKQKKLLAVV